MGFFENFGQKPAITSRKCKPTTKRQLNEMRLKARLDQAGPGAAKRGFGCESVNRLKTTCGRPGNPSWISRKSCPVCIRDMLSETIHEFECHRAIQGCFWGFSDRIQAQKHALGVCGPSECAGDLQEWFSYKFGKIWFLKIVRDSRSGWAIFRKNFCRKSCFAGFGVSYGPQSI